MYEWIVYEDDSTLLSGQWKGFKISEVPAQYFLTAYQNRNGHHDKALIAWIEKNLDRLKAEKDGVPFVPPAPDEVVLQKEPKKEVLCTKKTVSN